MGLEIRRINALLDIQRTPGRLEIRTQDAVLEYRRKHAKVNIETELPKIEIDQYEAFASAGLMNYLDLTKEAAQRGQNQVLEYIAKAAQDGKRLAAVEKGGNPIADIALRDAYPVHEFGMGTIPKVGPRFSVKGGSVRIDPLPNGQGITNGVEGTYTPGRVNFSYTPAEIRIYMKQYPSVQFRYTGENVDIRL